MPRLARPIFAGVAHHITQRGNRRENVFFSNADREAYLQWLAQYCAKHGVEVLAYCLMTNHMHVVAVPEEADGIDEGAGVVEAIRLGGRLVGVARRGRAAAAARGAAPAR